MASVLTRWQVWKMALNPHEELFTRAFVVPAKQDRYLSMLGSAKGRARLLAKFPHCRDLDMSYATLVPAAQQNAAAIGMLLKQRGAPAMCHVISADRDIDNRELTLEKALDDAVGMNMGTFISCVPGKLGYFEFEDLGERYILAR
jgi:hypothetical protein